MIEWLENQNRIDELCPRSLGPKIQSCRDEKLRPRTWSLDVRERPEADAIKLGKIVLVAVPGSGLTAAFHTPTAAIAFTPDLFLSDWGYGPYFHQTFHDLRNSWFLLPRDPLPMAGWIELSRLTKTPDIKYLAEAMVYELDGKGVVITRIRNGKISIRAEQPADMWCREEEPPKSTPAQERTLPISDLLTKEGHLKLTIKYMKGC